MSLELDLAYIRTTLGPGPYSHAQLQYAMQYVCGRMDGVVVWVNPTGGGEVDGNRYVRWGLAPGSTDLICIVAPHGRFVALEIKTGSGRPSKQQKAFIDLVRTHGGVAGVVRSIGEGVELIEEARHGTTAD